MNKKKILLLSAYNAQSHQTWCNNLLRMFPEYEWQVLSLPGRYFNWRIRGNALSWSLGQREVLDKQYDLVLATSMVDCATLRGLVPNLANIPWVVYFHENQFEYPVNSNNDHTEPKMVNLYNALCADKVIFNSEYNYQTFINGLRTFLKKMPDEVPATTIEVIENKHTVISVPIVFEKIIADKHKSNSTPILLWNHRWEYDKGPEQLYLVLSVLRERGFGFKLHLIGQQFRTIPEYLQKIKQEFQNELLNVGFIESSKKYRKILQQSDFVLSTAIHDFQGLALLEAVAAGCIPIVPERLAYKEIFPEQYRYTSDLSCLNSEAKYMADKIMNLEKKRKNINLDDINISRFSIDKLKPLYSKALFSS